MRGGSIIAGNTVVVSATEANFGGPSAWKGSRFTATAGTATTHDFEIGSTVKLYSGTYYTVGSVLGDRIEFEVYDRDGILGPAGSVVRRYVEDMYVVPQERRSLSNGQTATIPAGLFLRTTYHSTGSNPVDVLLDWMWFRIE